MTPFIYLKPKERKEQGEEESVFNLTVAM